MNRGNVGKSPPFPARRPRVKRRNLLRGPEPLEGRDQPAAAPLADVNPIGVSAVVGPLPGFPGPGVSAATRTAVVFRADDGTRAGLWATDGSAAGAVYLGVN